MRKSVLILLLSATAAAAIAQTAVKPPTTAAAKSVSKKPATAAAAKPTPAAKTATAGIKLPPGVPVIPGSPKIAFSLLYQEILVGTGAEAEPNKLYKVLYTGYRQADGVKFDSSDDHRQPVLDKDGKPEMGEDGKPKLGDVQPLIFPQGMNRMIPGVDQGFHGMKIGGKRRIFVPWQLAYGTHELPARADHPGIPAKSDLIFDVQLLDVSDLPPVPQNHPGMGAPGARPMPQNMPHPAVPGTPAAPAATTTPATPPPAAAAPATPAPAPAAPATPAAPEPQPK